MELSVCTSILISMLRRRAVFLWREMPLTNTCLSVTMSMNRKRIFSTSKGEEEHATNKFISGICDIVKQGGDWETLSSSIDTTRLTHLHIDKVLLSFKSSKSPLDAKLALKFFYWAGHAKREQVEHRLQSYSIITHMLVEANMFAHAQALLQTLIHKHCQSDIFEAFLNVYNSAGSSPLVFDSLIHAYAKARIFGEAITTCRLMTSHGFVPSLRSWNTLLLVVKRSDQTSLIWKIYEEMLGSRTYPNKITVKILVDALCKEGSLQKTIDFMDKIQRKRCPGTAVVNTALVMGVIKEGRVEEGSMLLKRMVKKSLIPITVAYSLMIYGHSKVGNLQQALDLHQEMGMKGLSASGFTYTALIGGYCIKRRIKEATDLMTEMKEQGLKPCNLTYNFLIEGYCKVGGLEEETINLQKEMLAKGFLPSVSVFNNLISNLCKINCSATANHILTILLDNNFTPNEVTYSNLIDGYCKEGKVEEVLKLYYEMEYRNLAPSPLTFTFIIKSVCMNRRFKEMERLLRVMLQRGLIADNIIYRTLIKDLCEAGKMDEVLQLFDELTKKGFVPDSHTHAILIKEICGQRGWNVNELLNGIEEFVLKSSE